MGVFARNNRIADEADPQVADVLRSLPDAFTSAPDSTTQTRHMAAIAAAAREAAHHETLEVQPDSGTRRRLVPAPTMKWRQALARNRRLMITAKFAASALALCGLMATLAVAGVTLPGPASDVAKSVGLPNQADDNASVTDIDGADRAAEARQNGEHGKPDDVPKGKGNGDDVSTESHGESHGIGDSVSDEAQNLGDAMREADTPEDRRQIADDFSNSVRQQAQERSRLPEQAQDTPQNDTEAQAGPETGETQSTEGKAIADEHRPDSPGRP